MSEQMNGVIDDTHLGLKDHGLLTAWIYIGFDGSGQGFGGHRLDGTGTTNYAGQKISALLQTLEVGSWEELKGVSVRVRFDKPVPDGRITHIGHFYKDKWFNWSKESS